MPTPVPPVLRTWRRLAPLPGGPRLFSLAVAFRAPYFRTVAPRFVEVDTGRAVVTMRHRRRVGNHLGTVHAIASCNLAEAAMGVAAEATVPTTHRWIPRGMSVEYRAVARTDVTATATFPDLEDLAPDTSRDVVVPVDVATADGTVYVHADITVWVSPRPAR